MNIKTIHSIIPSLLMLLVLFTGCGLDNYDEPKSMLRGKVVYNGEPVQVRGTDERVRLQLYQDGYQRRDPIDVFVTQDGSFSALLFDGEYKMVTRNGNGPWVNSRDTTLVTIKGGTDVNFEVTPFFTISNAALTLSGTTMNATFNINRVVADAEIDRVLLLLSKTAFVDDGFNIQRADFTQNLTTGTVNYSMELNDKAKESPILYARVCVWTKGADQGIYSRVVRFK